MSTEILCRNCQKKIEGLATRVVTVDIVIENCEMNKDEQYSIIRSLPETERYYHRCCLPQTGKGGV